MKLIIDVPEEVYEALKGITEDSTSLDPYSLADIIVNKSEVIEELKPQGDLISREALKKAINDNGCRHSHYFDIFDIIDNAPTVSKKGLAKDFLRNRRKTRIKRSDCL